MTARLAQAAILSSLAICVRADDLPAKVNFDRYKTMLEHSPFAVASAVVAPAATPNFAKDLYVANAGKSPDGDMVTIGSSSDREFKKYLTTRSPMDGYAIVSIEWSDKVGETKVTISKDGKFATLGFNEALLEQEAPRMPVALPPPGVNPSQRFKPAPIPTLPTPPSHVRGVIPRKPQVAPMPPNAAGPEAPRAGLTQKRCPSDYNFEPKAS